MNIKKIINYKNAKILFNNLNNPNYIIYFIHLHNSNLFELNTFFFSILKEKKIKFYFF